MKREIEEIREDIVTLAQRISQIFDFKVFARGLDEEGYLNENLDEVDNVGFAKLQNKLISNNLYQTAVDNSIRFVDKFREINPELKHEIEKLLLLMDKFEVCVKKQIVGGAPQLQSKKSNPAGEGKEPQLISAEDQLEELPELPDEMEPLVDSETTSIDIEPEPEQESFDDGLSEEELADDEAYNNLE